jgi:elongation factor P
MDNDNYEQITVSKNDIGEGVKWLMENMTIQVLLYHDAVIGVEMPNFVELLVVETEPGVKGDTATGASKAAKLESGASIQVPLFINTGDRLRIDTRTSEYMERV